MGYVVIMLVSVVLTLVCCVAGFWESQRRLREEKSALELERKKVRDALQTATDRQGQLSRREAELLAGEQSLHGHVREFESRRVTYHDLQQENGILRTDLRAMVLHVNKAKTDTELAGKRWGLIEEKSSLLAKRYLHDSVKAVVASVGPNNFSACKHRLLDVIRSCRDIGYEISDLEETSLLGDLRREFELAVRAQIEREEQARIKAQIREEDALQREIEREVKQAEREQAAIHAALDQALAAAKGEHDEEVKRLEAKLAEAEEKARRAISMAQLTKMGYVYVISNVGSLGVGVFKIGMTRRLVPQERVQELSFAAVPFPFDVHMMIKCNDAPALEHALHKAFSRHRVNKANPRKEFFRVTVQDILDVVKKQHGEVEYVADAEALEYRQSLAMPEEDALFIEKAYDDAEDEEIAAGD